MNLLRSPDLVEPLLKPPNHSLFSCVSPTSLFSSELPEAAHNDSFSFRLRMTDLALRFDMGPLTGTRLKVAFLTTNAVSMTYLSSFASRAMMAPQAASEPPSLSSSSVRGLETVGLPEVLDAGLWSVNWWQMRTKDLRKDGFGTAFSRAGFASTSVMAPPPTSELPSLSSSSVRGLATVGLLETPDAALCSVVWWLMRTA
mmetsp:Transcript_67594/g.171568  ORF Transcript_67594/g.171568 Transcript_67594/m.171568 type:complete len:200 (-) Transcript_67594:422-1021(-)